MSDEKTPNLKKKLDPTITAHILDLTNKIDQLIESHKTLVVSVEKINDAIYHPDKGIYSRIRELEREVIKDGDVRMAKLEETGEGVKKLQWMVIGSGVAAVVSVLIRTFVMA